MDSPHCKNLEKEKLCTFYTKEKIIELTKPKLEPVKGPTTLERIQKVWGIEDSLQIKENIDELEQFPRRSVKGLLRNDILLSALKKEIETLPRNTDIYLDRYERMTTHEFLVLLDKIDIDGVELKKNILQNIEKGSIFLYEEIENAVLRALESRKNNSSTVYLTSKNVRTSEFIKDAGITSFESVLNNFRDFNILANKSVSRSIIFNAHFEPSKSINSLRESNIPVTPFYFKIYPKKLQIRPGQILLLNNPGLDFEQLAYNQLFKLVQNNVTPNILCKVATSDLAGFNDIFLTSAKLSTETKTEFTKQVDKITYLKWLETGVIITQPGGETLDTKFTKLNPEEKRSVLFQLLYTLYVFEKIEFSHGDLHIGNIFILDIPEEVELCYIVEGQQYRFKTTKLVKIYDFDHGTFCKTTNIRVNRDSTFTINQKFNPTRETAVDIFNEKYAETNIFNKNLDLLIFTNNLSYICPNFFNNLTISSTDTEINDFFRECFPGFDSDNPLSQRRILTTLLDSLQTESNRLEANRIFGFPIRKAEEYKRYNIEQSVLDMTWLYYFEEIKNNLSRIAKNFNEFVENNHMWIPDTIVIPKNKMLASVYFKKFESDLPIDIRTMPVYTIDGRI